MTEPPSSPTDVVISYLAAFDERDPAAIAAHVSDDFVNQQVAALGNDCVGRATYRERLHAFIEQIPELHYEVEEIIADGIELAVFYTLGGKWMGKRHFSVRGVQRLRVVDGLITHRIDYWDSATFLHQIDNEAAEALRRFGIE